MYVLHIIKFVPYAMNFLIGFVSFAGNQNNIMGLCQLTSGFDGLESVELSRISKAGLAEKVVGVGEADNLFTSISGVEWDAELVHLLVLNQRHDLFADAH